MGRYAPSTHTGTYSVAQQKNYPVGVYEGGGYSFKGIYRPAYNCRMKTNEHPNFARSANAQSAGLSNFMCHKEITFVKLKNPSLYD